MHERCILVEYFVLCSLLVVSLGWKRGNLSLTAAQSESEHADNRVDGDECTRCTHLSWQQYHLSSPMKSEGFPITNTIHPKFIHSRRYLLPPILWTNLQTVLIFNPLLS